MSKQLNIRSDEAYAAATRLAQRLGTTTTDAVLRALRKLEQDTYKPLKREEFTPEQADTYSHFKELALKARREAVPASAAPAPPAPVPVAPLPKVTLTRTVAAMLAPAPASPAADVRSSEEKISLALGGKK